MAWSDRHEQLFVHNLDRAVNVYHLHDENLLQLMAINLNEATFLPKTLALAFDDTALLIGGDEGNVPIFELKDFAKIGSLVHGSSKS
jgi:hypothetical protein